MMPPKPKVIAQDLRAFFARRERHNWIAMLFALAIPLGIFYLFVLDGRTNIFSDEPVVIYAESWPLDRSDEAIRLRQSELAIQADEYRAASRERFQQMADGLGIDYDREAAAEADRISIENQALGERLEAQRESQAEVGAAER